MNRMWDKIDIIKLIQEYAPGFDPSEIPEGDVPQDAVLGIDADGDIVKGNLFGKYVRIIPAPASTTLTPEEVAEFEKGVFINGNFAGYKNPVIFPIGVTSVWGSRSFILISTPATSTYGSSKIELCRIDSENKFYELGAYIEFHNNIAGQQGVNISGLRKVNAKLVPDYPGNTDTRIFACVNGTLTWKNPLFLHTIIFDVGLGQTFTIRLMSDSKTPCALDGVSGNFTIDGASFVNPVNMGNVVIIPFGANQITPDIYAFDSATGAFTDNITLASVTSDTVTPL